MKLIDRKIERGGKDVPSAKTPKHATNVIDPVVVLKQSLGDTGKAESRKGRATTKATGPKHLAKQMMRGGIVRSKLLKRSDKFVEPMKALAVPEVPAGEWLLEIKFDGYRALAIMGGGDVQLWSRNENVLSGDYPEIIEALATVKTKDAVIDGEIVALDERGRPRFQLLQGLAQNSKRPPIFYYVFDLLRLDGVSYLDEPIERRKAALEKLLKKTSPLLKVSPVFTEKPKVLLAYARKHGFEGIMAKARHSRYELGRRSGSWVKCRLARDQEFVIGGFTPPNGARPYFGAILVGYYDGERMLYAGKVGTGFDQELLRSLHGTFEKLKTERCPFSNLPMERKPRFGQGMTASAMREVTWLRPKLVGQIRFSEWTREGSLRQPVFLGLRKDKSAKDVVREVIASDAETTSKRMGTPSSQ